MLTPVQAKEHLRRAGKSAADVARELNVKRATVAGVLSGHLRGDYGDAHKVAVHLGIKDGVIVSEGTPLKEAMKVAGGAR